MPKPEAHVQMREFSERVGQSTDLLVGRLNALIKQEERIATNFEHAVREQKASSRWAAFAAIASMISAFASLIAVLVTYLK